jgi:hypothetical protein
VTLRLADLYQSAKQLRKGLDNRINLDLDRFVIGRDRRDLPINAEQLIDNCLRN